MNGPQVLMLEAANGVRWCCGGSRTGKDIDAIAPYVNRPSPEPTKDRSVPAILAGGVFVRSGLS